MFSIRIKKTSVKQLCFSCKMGFFNDFVREIEVAFDPNNNYWNFGRIAIIFRSWSLLLFIKLLTMRLVLSAINCMLIPINRI